MFSAKQAGRKKSQAVKDMMTLEGLRPAKTLNESAVNRVILARLAR
ncbi:hypothetical protein PUN4_350040 [Paraburkholderia unamae]|nr:hypothetical protein PUN4_350040 [Paraburkholderia unamae]